MMPRLGVGSVVALLFLSCCTPAPPQLARNERLRLAFVERCPSSVSPESLFRRSAAPLPCVKGLTPADTPQSWLSTDILEQCVDSQGVAQGPFRIWSDSGELWLRGTMRNGLMDGLMARWHASGALAYCVAYQSGQKDGYEIGWFDTNPPQLKSSTQYRDGKLHGEMLRWAPNGQLLVEGEYFRGQAVGTWRYWNADGVFLGSYFLQNGTGKMRGWHDNGVLAWEGETEHGLEVGSWLFWNDKGELLGWCDYHDDGSANCEGETRGVSRPSLDETWREMQKRQ